MKKTSGDAKLTIDGVEYAVNELAISNTARAGYLKTLKADLARGAKSSG